jgi:hypothetical protein
MDESLAADALRAHDMIYGAERLRRFGTLSRSLQRRENAELVLAFIGDSWVRGSGLPAQGDPSRVRYFMPGLSASLQQRYGDAGGGWCGLSYATSSDRRGGSANSNRLYQTGVGSWTTHVNNRPVPDLCTGVSRVPGDSIRITNTTGPTSAVNLHYLPGGTIEYRWSGGAWSRLELGSAQPRVAALRGFPRSGAWTLDLRVVSGIVELAGIEHRSGQPGIRIHNLGAGGSAAHHWSAVDASAWSQALASFGCHTLLMLFGTNDQKQLTPDAHRQSLQQLIRTIRHAAPEADLGLGTPPESGDTTAPRPSRPMHLYSAAARELAVADGLCHVDLQAAFGKVAEYRHAGSRPLLDASLIHPCPAGSQVLEKLYLRLLEPARMDGPSFA